MATKLATKIVEVMMKWAGDPSLPAGNESAAAHLDKFLAGRIIKRSTYDHLKRVEKDYYSSFDFMTVGRLEEALTQEKIVSDRHYNRAQSLKDRLWDTEKELAETKKILDQAKCDLRQEKTLHLYDKVTAAINGAFVDSAEVLKEFNELAGWISETPVIRETRATPSIPQVSNVVTVSIDDMPAPLSLWQRVTNWSR